MKMTLSQATFDAIHNAIGKWPAERGGILGSGADGVIRHFVPDTTAHCTGAAYDPDIAAMNLQIKAWKSNSICFRGFVHSHPRNVRDLSFADKEYAQRILSAFPKLDWLALPLVMTKPNSGVFEIIPFAAIPDDATREHVSFRTVPMEIEGNLLTLGVTESSCDLAKNVEPAIHSLPTSAIGAEKRENAIPLTSTETQSSETVSGKVAKVRTQYYGDSLTTWNMTMGKMGIRSKPSVRGLPNPKRAQQSNSPLLFPHSAKIMNQHFERVQTAYDLPLLASTRLVVIGTGGAVGLIRDAARAGFGEFILIEPDEVSATNIGTQSFAPSQIGRPKADVLAEDIRAINPQSAVVVVQDKIEAVSDRDFELLAFEAIRSFPATEAKPRTTAKANSKQGYLPANVVLLVLTDSFEAQARGHRLGLQFGLSTICAQEYLEGRGAEITYTVPGVTPACHRCITASRYSAYLTKGYKNTVTSHGAPIFAAQMLNSALGFILLAVAHHGSNQPRYGNQINRLGNRNLILLRMDPDFDSFVGWPAFSRPLIGAARPEMFVMLDSLFLSQTADTGQSESRPLCPDCGGTGDLRACLGSFHDTREMRTAFPLNSPKTKRTSRPRLTTKAETKG